MTKVFWEYSTRNIKKQLLVKEEPIAVINVSYPEFAEMSGKQNIFVSKINKFYKYTADKYTDYILRKYPSKALKVFSGNGRIKLSFLMNFAVSYNTQDTVSVFTDLSYFDGHTKKSVRFSQNWSPEHSAILPPSMCLDTGKRSKRLIIKALTEIAAENMKRRNFNYFADYEMLVKRRFDFDNFYFVPNGTAFFYNSGVLSEDAEPSVFVVPENIVKKAVK